MTTEIFTNEFHGMKSRVLIVDDDPVSREMLRFSLIDDFDVEEVASGEACLEAIAANPPDLVVLDIEMPGMNGYETCRKLRESTKLPIIFVSSHDTLDERVEAFDSGGNDFVIKPFDAEILLRKVKQAIAAKLERDQLAREKNKLDKTASEFLSKIGDGGVLLQFMRNNLSCSDQHQLAANLLEAAGQFGVNCHVQIRDAKGNITLTPLGMATPLEESVMERSKDLGRVFQFKHRVLINYNMVSIIALNMPEDVDATARIGENLSILAETAEAIAETVSARQDSALQSEQLQVASINTSISIEAVREMYRAQLNEGRLLLQRLVDEVENAYIYLGLTDNQEHMVTETMQKNVAPVLHLFEQSDDMEQKFNEIIDSLTNKKGGGDPEIWLF